jgi:hypothetical protein
VPQLKTTTHGHRAAHQQGGGNRPRATGQTVSTRAIGTAGTVARILVGVVLLGSVVTGEASRGWHPAAWVLALAVFPLAALAAARLRARWHPAGLRATGPAGHAANAVVFAALYATPWYAPPLSFTSDAALVFYGASMLLAAARGYAGCEVLAVPNWLLRRDDQVGCVVFAPVDAIERRKAAARP